MGLNPGQDSEKKEPNEGRPGQDGSPVLEVGEKLPEVTSPTRRKAPPSGAPSQGHTESAQGVPHTLNDSMALPGLSLDQDLPVSSCCPNTYLKGGTESSMINRMCG